MAHDGNEHDRVVIVLDLRGNKKTPGGGEPHENKMSPFPSSMHYRGTRSPEQHKVQLQGRFGCDLLKM